MEFGSQADLIKNEAGMAVNAESSNKGILTRTESKRSEFETVRRVFEVVLQGVLQRSFLPLEWILKLEAGLHSLKYLVVTVLRSPKNAKF